MQFRKTQKNKKRFRGGNMSDYVVNLIRDNTPTAAYDTLRNLCTAEGIGCRENFLNIIRNPNNLALAGISAAAYAAYLLHGTRAKQDEILQKIEKVKRERRESEESSDSTDHSDSKYDESSLSDEDSQKTYKKKPSKKFEEIQQKLHELGIGDRSKHRSSDRKSKHHSSKSKQRSSNRKSAGRRR
jgi:hypothetical protein